MRCLNQIKVLATNQKKVNVMLYQINNEFQAPKNKKCIRLKITNTLCAH